MLLQVMVEYSGTPSGPFSLGGLLSSPVVRWVLIGLVAVAVFFLFRRSRLSTVLILGALAAAAYYGRAWIGW
jgi:hypothetical protein